MDSGLIQGPSKSLLPLTEKKETRTLVNISTFYRNVLGANLRNPRWAWGAVDPMMNRIFLRVWKDEIEPIRGGKRVLVRGRKPGRSKNGFHERNRHLDQIRKGAEGYGVVCQAVDVKTHPRRIREFDEKFLLKLGKQMTENGRIYARIDGRVAVAGVTRRRTAESTLTEDIKELGKLNVDSTTKEALVNARIGQGFFRSEVLRLWGSRCAVTGSVTLDAIRASHIKPWRESTNEERLDPENGLPLVASLDALFDAGLISFESSGKLVVSSELNSAERGLFGVVERSLAKSPFAKTADYLAYHRDHVFKR